MATARGRQSKIADELELLRALKFISVAQVEIGNSPGQMHSRFHEGYIMAYDGTLAAGYPVNETMVQCPHTLFLVEALSHVTGSYTMTQVDNGSLVVTAGRYRGVVPCIAPNDMPWVKLNPPAYKLGDDWKEAALEAGTLCSDNATLVRDSCIYSDGFTLVGLSNNECFIQRTHQSEMPSGMLIPMMFVKAVAKVPEKIVAYGFSPNSLTIYFENRSWIQTQLYAEQYPDIHKLTGMFFDANLTEAPADLFEAVKSVVKFSKDNYVVIDNNQVRSHDSADTGAQYQCEGLPFKLGVKHKILLSMQPFIKRIDFTSQRAIVFAGENVRGFIAKT